MLQQWIEMYEFISIYFVNIFVNLKKKKKKKIGENEIILYFLLSIIEFPLIFYNYFWHAI